MNSLHVSVDTKAQNKSRDLTAPDIMNHNLSLHGILTAVSQVTGVPMDELTGGRGVERECSRARHVFCWVARRYTLKSLKQIADAYGMKQHGSVMYGVRAVENNPRYFISVINAVTARLGAG